MNAIIHMDVAAVLVLVTILATNIYRRLYKDMASIVFNALIVTTLVAALCECAVTIMYAAGCRSDIAFMLVKSVYVFVHSFATPVYFLYIISIARTWHIIKKRPALAVLFCVPIAVDLVIIIVNIFTGFMFSFENGVEHNHVANLHYACAAVYIFLAIVYVVRNSHLFKLHQKLALASMLPLSVASVLCRQFFPNSMVALFSNAIGIMIMSMVIQRPEAVVDTTTLLNKYSAYADDMRKAFINKNHVTVILVNIGNYSSVYHILGYDETNSLLRKIADGMNDINRELKAYASIYYLDRGRYRVVINAFNEDKVKQFAYNINEMLREKQIAKHIDIALEPYVCVARCPEDIEDINSLMSFGSDFHHKVVNSGDVIIAEELFKQREFSLVNQMDDIIDRALEERSLTVYYQPIYSVSERRFTSAEALVRLIDSEHGFVPPDLFIPAAERNGTIHKIGAYVLDEVCRFIASEDFKKLNLDYIEINLSVAQCMQSDLADQVLSTLKRHGVSVDQINLEITETAASYNLSALTENMAKLSNAGVSFSLDDFGTGYSNMERVASLPLKIVKLDRSFVNSQDKPKMRVFLENFIRMFKDMDMEIVVEGIETEQMVRRFSDLRCDFIQGYYYSKPVPQKDFVKFIEKNKVA